MKRPKNKFDLVWDKKNEIVIIAFARDINGGITDAIEIPVEWFNEALNELTAEQAGFKRPRLLE